VLILFSLKSSSSLLIVMSLGTLTSTDTPEIIVPFPFKGAELITLHHLVCICVAEDLDQKSLIKTFLRTAF